MKNKKLLWLLVGLVSVCVILAACKQTGNPTEPTQEVTQGPTEGEEAPTQAPTAPEETEPEETGETEPEETATEPTEPEETEASGGATQPNLNTGTGGGYNPGGSTDPTEPTEPTEEPVEEPEPNTQNNQLMLIVVLAVVLIGGGIFFVVKSRKNPKGKTRGNSNLDDYDFGDDDEGEYAEFEQYDPDSEQEDA